jgi:hypothetical protein
MLDQLGREGEESVNLRLLVFTRNQPMHVLSMNYLELH